VPPSPAEVYPHGHHDSVLRSHRWRTVENSAAYLVPHLRDDQQLLDVGTGPGTITVDLAERLSHGLVVGIDNADTAVAATAALGRDRGVNNLTVAASDVYALGFRDDAFDVVHAHQVLQHLADPVRALREMARVCAPGGVLAAREADYAAMTWYPAAGELTRWLELYRQVARVNGGEPDAGRRLTSWASAAGLRQVEATASAWCFASPEDLTWWTQTWADRILRSDFSRQAVARGLSDRAELSRLSDGWLRWGQQPNAWFSVLHGEIICRP
jgi:SAM-dependent methyltransferase